MALSYLLGSIPFTNLAARRLKGVDLRRVGNGTVSGTGLHQVAGFGPLAAVGCLELAKGAAVPLIARHRGARLAALTAGAAVAGHNWSPFLRLHGGRGVSVALGASLVTAPEGAAVLGLGLGGGRLARQSGAGCAAAISVLPLLLAARRGREGLLLGVALALPLTAKRLAGNYPPPRRDLRHYAYRFLFDADPEERRSRVSDGPAKRTGSRRRSGEGVEGRRQQPASVAAAQQY